MSITTTAACIRGCTRRRRHLTECPGDEDCRGCEPRRAEYGRLCWPCHKRLELMLTQAEITERWLTGNLPSGMKAARGRQDYEQRGSQRDAPAPLNLAILDVRQLLADRLSAWVDDLCERRDLTGPGRHGIVADAAYLVTWLDVIERFDWIGDWWEELSETLSDAHALAPWRPEAMRLPSIECPECHAMALVIFGGESTVVCTDCRGHFDESRFGVWTQIIESAG